MVNYHDVDPKSGDDLRDFIECQGKHRGIRMDEKMWILFSLSDLEILNFSHYSGKGMVLVTSL